MLTLGTMGNIGKERRRIEVLPVPQPVPQPETTPAEPKRAEPARDAERTG